MKINEIKKRIDNLMTVQVKEAVKHRSALVADGNEDLIRAAQAYILALMDVHELVDNFFKELKNVGR